MHDLSDGGLLVAIAEMALASGIGAKLYGPPAFLTEHGFWFGEDQARYVVTIKADQADALAAQGEDRGRADPPHRLDAWQCADPSRGAGASARRLRERHEGWLPAYMAGGAN